MSHCLFVWPLTTMSDWLKANDFLAIWIEGIALVLLFIWELKGRKEQHEEMLQQLDIARKQIHADRVAEIFRALRQFENWLVDSVHKTKRFGPGRDYSIPAPAGIWPTIFPEYLALQEAYYLSYLVSAPLADYMKERMGDADALQRIADNDQFYQKLQEFHLKWDVYKMAAKIRELS
jgi:hypothetical protein